MSSLSGCEQERIAVPLFDYRCQHCSAVTEVFVRPGGATASAVRCPRCGSAETRRTVSRFSFKAERRARYSEAFREQAAPFLKSRPGAREFFAEGGESEEAKLYRLTEHIGRRVDTILQDQVFNRLNS